VRWPLRSLRWPFFCAMVFFNSSHLLLVVVVVLFDFLPFLPSCLWSCRWLCAIGSFNQPKTTFYWKILRLPSRLLREPFSLLHQGGLVLLSKRGSSVPSAESHLLFTFSFFLSFLLSFFLSFFLFTSSILFFIFFFISSFFHISFTLLITSSTSNHLQRWQREAPSCPSVEFVLRGNRGVLKSLVKIAQESFCSHLLWLGLWNVKGISSTL